MRARPTLGRGAAGLLPLLSSSAALAIGCSTIMGIEEGTPYPGDAGTGGAAGGMAGAGGLNPGGTGGTTLACGGGEVDCSGACVDLETDGEHCGSCGAACSPVGPSGEPQCIGGHCVLLDEPIECGGAGNLDGWELSYNPLPGCGLSAECNGADEAFHFWGNAITDCFDGGNPNAGATKSADMAAWDGEPLVLDVHWRALSSSTGGATTVTVNMRCNGTLVLDTWPQIASNTPDTGVIHDTFELSAIDLAPCSGAEASLIFYMADRWSTTDWDQEAWIYDVYLGPPR